MAGTALNLSNTQGLPNTGNALNAPKFLDIKRAIAIPTGFTIPAASCATTALLLAYVQAAIVQDTKASRWQITPTLTDQGDQTEKRGTEKRDAATITTSFGLYNWSFLMSFTNEATYVNWLQYRLVESFDWLFIDSVGSIKGTAGADGTKGSMSGFNVREFLVDDAVPTMYNKLARYPIGFQLADNSQWTTNGKIVPIALPVTVNGLRDVVLSQGATTPNTTSILYVSGVLGGNVDVDLTTFTQFATPANWLINVAGTPVVPTSVAIDLTNLQFVITKATSWTSGANITVQLAVPTTLLALNPPVNLESNIFTIIVP